MLTFFSKQNQKEGFTLIEMILVVALTALLLVSTLQSVIGSTDQLSFTASYQKVLDLVRQARSLAVSGKAQPDYTDYDQDECYDFGYKGSQVPPPCTTDSVTPAHYGIYFEQVTSNGVTDNNAILFADMHAPAGSACQEGKFDLGQMSSGCDLILEKYTLPSTISLKGLASSSQCLSAFSTCYTIFYSPIFADVSFVPALSSGSFFIFGLAQQKGGVELRRHCEQIHEFSGIPEVLDPLSSGCQALS